jgi:hypothetical protein
MHADRIKVICECSMLLAAGDGQRYAVYIGKGNGLKFTHCSQIQVILRL